jgi:hypothetical protein
MLGYAQARVDLTVLAKLSCRLTAERAVALAA